MTRSEELEPVHREEDGELVGYLSTERRDGARCAVAQDTATLTGAELDRLTPARPGRGRSTRPAPLSPA